MNFKWVDNHNPYGMYLFTSKDVKTGEIIQIEKHNVLVQGFHDAIHKFFDQAVSGQLADVLNLTHIAVGDELGSANRGDTALNGEFFRKPLTFKDYSDNMFTASLSLSAIEGNAPGKYIRNVGVFANATDTAGSGLLISKSLATIRKDSNTELLIQWFFRD